MKMSKTKLKTVLIGTFAFAVAITVEAEAACNSTVNGYSMPWNECEAACEIYGSYPNGDYVRDAQGNWANIHNPSERGNIYRDARFSRGCHANSSPSNDSGCTTPGWFGSACIW
jgi:hypothetical protein